LIANLQHVIFLIFHLLNDDILYSKKNHHLKGGILKILHVGDLRSSFGSSFHDYLYKILIPVLKNIKFQFEINLVGKYNYKIDDLPKNVKINYLGFQEKIDNFFDKNDLYFLASDYPVGIRTRVITASAYGIPVLINKTPLNGLIHYKHNLNCLIFINSKDLKHIFEQIINKKIDLNNIGINGRKLWETYYNPSINVKKILNKFYE
jgi:hypothetical protein